MSHEISLFANLEDDENNGDVGELHDHVPQEMKYLPVKTEIIEVEVIFPPGTNLTDEEIGDHLFNSFGNTSESDGINVGTVQETEKRRGGRKRTQNERRTQLGQKMKREEMALVDGKEELREKGEVEMEARMSRMRTRQHKEPIVLVADASSQRPTRQAKTRVLEKQEPDSEDDQGFKEFCEDDDNDEDYGSKKKRIGTRKSTPRTRRGGRTPRMSRRNISDLKLVEGEKDEPRQSGEESALIKTEVKEENGEIWSKSRAPQRPRGSGRKRMSEMSEEEREAVKAKRREAVRIRRARQRDTMPPHEREEYLRVRREKRRAERALAKATMTEAEMEEEKRKVRERKREKRALRTPEQRQEELQREKIRRIEKQVQMTEEEEKSRKMNIYLQKMARVGNLSKEEIEERRRSKQEWAKRRRAQMTADDLERNRRRGKEYRDNMSAERKERFLSNMREYYRRRRERLLREDPNKRDELLARRKERDRLRLQRMKEMGLKRKRSRKEQKEREERRRRIELKKKAKKKCVRKAPPTETAEEKAQRIQESKQRTQRKIRLRKKLEMQKLLQSGVSFEEIQQQSETPEQREKRLIRHRINCAKRSLRKRLEKCNVPEEEIEARLQELQHTYRPTFEFRPFKPRPDRRKPVTKKDLEFLSTRKDTETNPEVVIQPVAVVTCSKEPRALSSVSAAGSSCSVIKSTAVVATGIQPNNSLPSLVYPPLTSNPAEASACHTQLVSPPPQQDNTTTPYHIQHKQLQMCTNQQPQTPQTNTNSFQMVFDINYHDTKTTGTVVTSSPSIHIIYQQQVLTPTPDTSSQHGDYERSYDTHSLPPPSSPLEDEDYSGGGGTCDDDLSFQPPKTSTTESVRKEDKSEPAGPKEKKTKSGGGRPPGPRGPKKSTKTNVIRDTVCDECGNAYNHDYIREHKNQLHNPNYKNQTCQICGEKFTVARKWYRHYVKTHHVKPTKDIKVKRHMCDMCGRFFRIKYDLEKHKYSMHGEGMNRENWKQCPVCPEQVLFKDTVGLYAHLNRRHPGYNRGTQECYRCDQNFPNENELRLHVKREHVESYFPCDYCNACTFTKWAQNSHHLRCKKISKERREELRKEKGMFSWDRAPLPCEFCSRSVVVSSLTRHYWEMHNVQEDKFRCPDCGKEFRVRAYWAVHMEEKHLKSLDEMSELVAKLNVVNREGLVIKNPGGVVGGVPGNTPGKAAAQKRKELVGVGKKERAKRKTAKVKKTSGGRNGKKQIVVTAEEEEQGIESSACKEETKDDEEEIKIKKRPRRKIIVIAEEEEVVV